MPAGHFTTTPAKGDLVINPKTNRPIKVGGTVWVRLVREGIFEGIYSDTKELGKLPENEEDIEEELEQIQKTLPIGKQAVRGRGKFKGKIVSRAKPMDSEEVSRYTAKVASRMAKEKMAELTESEDMESELERMILHEMATQKVIKKPVQSKTTVKPVAIQKRQSISKKEQYRLRKEQTTTEEEEEENEDTEAFENEEYEEYE